MRGEASSLQTQNQDFNKDNQLIKGSLTIFESQNNPMEVESDAIRERQEYAVLVPLIKVARGEEVEVDRVNDAIVNSLDLVINKNRTDKEASYVFKNARDMITVPDKAVEL